MVNLFISAYDEKNEVRKRELDQCLMNNISNEYIDVIFVLLAEGTKEPVQNRKVRYIESSQKPTFKDFFEIINLASGEEDINIISNSDIFFDESLCFLSSIGNDECWALSRWEINADGNKGNQIQNRGDSQDVWIVKGKVKELTYCDFPLAKLGCDNRIAWEFQNAGYKVTNPSLHVRAWHNHVSEIRNYCEVVRDVVEPPYLVQIMPSYITANMAVTYLPYKDESNPDGRIKLLHVGLSATGEPHNGLQKAFIKHFDYQEIYTGTPNINEAMLAKVAEFKPDIVFIQIQTDGYIWEQTIVDIKATGAFVLNFTGDVRHPIPTWYYGLGQHLDLTLFSNMTDVEQMRKDGYRSEYLEMGIDPEIYKPTGDIISSHPILFMGNHYGCFPLSNFRMEMVEYMKAKFGNRFGVYGNGWPQNNGLKVSGNYNDSQPNEAAIYRASKIAINVSHFNYKRYSSDRLLRILASGVMCLCYKYEDMPYKNGIHLKTWTTFEELETLCRHYLNNGNERAAIAKAGCDFVHSTFTFENMILNIRKLYDTYK